MGGGGGQEEGEVRFKAKFCNSSKGVGCNFVVASYYTIRPLQDWGPLMVAQWLGYCATNRKVAGSIPDGVIAIFHSHNPSDRTTALGSTQPLTEMRTRNISWGIKAAGA
jgi:hypothetical protein